MPFVHFCGDPHGDFAALRHAAAARPQAVVLLGDLDLERPLAREMEALTGDGIRVLWIHGNHDMQARAWHDNLMFGGLAEGALHCRVAEVGGVRFAGLGGIFMSRVWRPAAGAEAPPFADRAAWRAAHPDADGIPLSLRGAIWPEDYAAATRLRADVLVCHEAPSSHRKGFAAIDALAAAIGARLVVHGHHHESYEAVLPGGIRAVGVANRAVWTVRLDELTRPGSRPDCRPAAASG